MGQTGSKTQVHVHIDKPFYYAGDIVTGFVVLHTETAMSFNSINIKVQNSTAVVHIQNVVQPMIPGRTKLP
jgi:hypothetical protein